MSHSYRGLCPEKNNCAVPSVARFDLFPESQREKIQGKVAGGSGRLTEAAG